MRRSGLRRQEGASFTQMMNGGIFSGYRIGIYMFVAVKLGLEMLAGSIAAAAFVMYGDIGEGRGHHCRGLELLGRVKWYGGSVGKRIWRLWALVRLVEVGGGTFLNRCGA